MTKINAILGQYRRIVSRRYTIKKRKKCKIKQRKLKKHNNKGLKKLLLKSTTRKQILEGHNTKRSSSGERTTGKTETENEETRRHIVYRLISLVLAAILLLEKDGKQ